MSKLNPLNWLDFLLQVKNEDRTFVQIIFWWELRRILYNFIVGIVGIACLMALWKLVPQRGSQDVPEPMAVVAFGYFCNMCYCLGWITESLLYTFVPITGDHGSSFNPRKTYGPVCFKLGLCFTLFMIILPVLIWGVIDLLLYLEWIPLEEVL